MINSIQVLASYGGYPVDPYWQDVLVLFDCDAARLYNPTVVFGTTAHGWVAVQLQDAFLALPERLWYHSATPDGNFEYTGKTGYAGELLQPAYTALNSNICMVLVPGSNGPIVFNDAMVYQIPVDIVGSPNSPGQITTNIPLKGTEFIASDGTNFYAFGSISNWTTPNEVYKSTDNGATWTNAGVMSGTTFPFPFDATTGSGDAVVKRIGSRWFMVITTPGSIGGTDGRRLYYTDSADPVTGWTAATGINIVANDLNDQLRYPIVYDGVGTHYITRSRLSVSPPGYTAEIYRSTDGGASWTLDYTLLPAGVNSFTVGLDVSNPTAGGVVRATISGAGANFWLEHTIGDPNGTWTQRNFGNTVPNWLVPATITPGATEVFINAQNSGGVGMGMASDLVDYIAGALTYTTSTTSVLEYNPSPNMLYSRYDSQLAAEWYITRLPAYPLGYIDTSVYKWGTVPGDRKHDTAPASLRCNGGLTTSNVFTEWEFGTADWTIEFWTYTSTPSQTATLFNFIPLSGFGPFNFMVIGGSLSFFAFDDTNAFLANMNSVAALPTNSWNFITAQRSGGTITLYLNGVSVANSTFSPTAVANWPTISETLNFGAYSDGGLPYYGWLDDIRVTKNVARYSGNFTPPDAPFPERGPV